MARFASINQVPERLRKLRHSRLSLGQIETILAAAEASKKPFAVALGEAQAQFMAGHVERDGQWIKKQRGDQ